MAWLVFGLLFLLDGCCAQFVAPFGGASSGRSQSSSSCANDCSRLERLSAMEPTHRIESEAGVTEYFDPDAKQLRCAGVAAFRCFVEPRGLVLPKYNAAPGLIYVLQGTGMLGMVMPGCPETYQDISQEQEHARNRMRDQHQQIRRFRRGDVIAVPSGITYWIFNDGDSPVTAVSLADTSSNANQLDNIPRQFLLAGSLKRSSRRQQQPFLRSEQQRMSSGDNILSGFDTDMLAEILGVSKETAKRMQGEDDKRGEIVRVEEKGMQFLRPQSQRTREEEEGEEYVYSEDEESECHRRPTTANGVDESICHVKVRENIDDPNRADFFIPNGGRITNLDSHKLPILRFLRLNAERGVLHRNAYQAPHWNMNAHSIVYCTGGRARVQIVDHLGTTVFDGQLRQGQLIVVPQNFAVLKKASNEGFQWVSFKTNDMAITSSIAGKSSVLRGLHATVVANAYRISREEALKVKFNREGLKIFQGHDQRGRGEEQRASA